MTSMSPWAAPTSAGPTAPVLPPPPQPVPWPTSGGPLPPVAPPPHPPRRGRRWLRVAGAAAVVLAAMAGSAAVTYAVAHNNSHTATPQPRQSSAADGAAAKDRVCHVFDVSTRNQGGQGGILPNGELNVPVALRTLNGVVAVQNALTPATPPDVAAAAKKYIDTTLDLTTAAMDKAPVDEGNRLTDIANNATFALADVCGLPH